VSQPWHWASPVLILMLIKGQVKVGSFVIFFRWQIIIIRQVNVNGIVFISIRTAAATSRSYDFFIQADSSFTAGGKIDLKNYDFTFIFCRPNLLSIRHIISKNWIYKLIRSNFGIFSIISCLIYSILWHMHTEVFSHNFTMLNQF
jgi:hypothetical protein